MEVLFEYQARLLQQVDDAFMRSAYPTIPWKERFVAIKGLRGIGKTTLLLQHLKYDLRDTTKHLYVTLDHPWFYNRSLYDLAVKFHQLGGETLLVDEVHKLENWSAEIKMIYDTIPGLQVICTASSALDLYKGEADLSRRVHTIDLPGLSFREYLILFHQLSFPSIKLQELINDHILIAEHIVKQCKPLALLDDYLKRGYFPFSKVLGRESFEARLVRTLETVLTEDISYVEGFTRENISKLKKLLGVLSESAPFTVNVSAIADKLNIGRNSLKTYLHILEKAGLINFLNREGKGIAVLQKPDKIYLENTNFSYALKAIPDQGTIRETFALNQLKNAGYTPLLPVSGDFKIIQQDATYVFETGGKSKSSKQLNTTVYGFVLSDDIEVGYHHKIPLYLLGLLY